MQLYSIFFIIVNALNVSGVFSAHHQELKNCTYSIGCMYSFLAPDDGRRNSLKHVEHSHNKEYFITLHLVGYT